MQTLLQYRRIGRRVQEEARTKKEKVEERFSTNHRSSPSRPERPEKGDHGSRGRSPDNTDARGRLYLDQRVTKNSDTTLGGSPHTQSNRKDEEDHVIMVELSGEQDQSNPRNGRFGLGAGQRAAKEFHVSRVAESLATAIYLFGTGTGALLAGPISETIRRNPSYLISFPRYMLAVMGTALAPNFAAQVVLRFFAGFFASPSMAIFGGSLADMFDKEELGFVWSLFATSPIIGHLLAPIATGWIVQSSLTWRWVEWVTLILSATVFIIAVLFLPETSGPILLQWKAEQLRRQSGSSQYTSPNEGGDSLFKRLHESLSHIFFYIFMEPITMLTGIYMTVLYILIFTFLHGFTFIFSTTYGYGGFRKGLTGTVFVAIVIGVALAVAATPVFHFYRKKGLDRVRAADGPDADFPPENRLLPAVFGSTLLPASLFWLAWTNSVHEISPWSDIGAEVLFGIALMIIFASIYHYVIESYQTESAGAVASITFMRYYASGGMVMADIPMYRALGVRWTLTLLGAVGIVLIPVPWLFWKFGDRIRRKSRFAA